MWTRRACTLMFIVWMLFMFYYCTIPFISANSSRLYRTVHIVHEMSTKIIEKYLSIKCVLAIDIGNYLMLGILKNWIMATTTKQKINIIDIFKNNRNMFHKHARSKFRIYLNNILNFQCFECAHIQCTVATVKREKTTKISI